MLQYKRLFVRHNVRAVYIIVVKKLVYYESH